MEDPTRPAMTSAVSTGPSSRMRLFATAVPIAEVGRMPSSWYFPCQAVVAPAKMDTVNTSGTESVPMRTICSSVRRGFWKIFGNARTTSEANSTNLPTCRTEASTRRPVPRTKRSESRSALRISRAPRLLRRLPWQTRRRHAGRSQKGRTYPSTAARFFPSGRSAVSPAESPPVLQRSGPVHRA
ncbi:MAG: hypothetical protein BWY06_02351 [Candidatus Latescibacteria bacterium ADurb.Bin168]|nr:MAG: hypothetical protein BWY06_02351 [Candidatus Latescibacteria bacterium ADurb.Bin168]